MCFLPLCLATSALHPDAFCCYDGLKREDPIEKALAVAECIRQLGESTSAGVTRDSGGGGGGKQDSWRSGVRQPEEADAEQVQPDTKL
ncbi:unnamed protein product, partial [Urochloa humidicola]